MVSDRHPGHAEEPCGGPCLSRAKGTGLMDWLRLSD